MTPSIDRRKFDKELKKRLSLVEDKLESHVQTGDEWRKGVCIKVDNLRENAKEFKEYVHDRFHDVMNSLGTMTNEMHLIRRSLDKKPCDSHNEKMKGIERRINWLWALIVLILGAIAKMSWK